MRNLCLAELLADVADALAVGHIIRSGQAWIEHIRHARTHFFVYASKQTILWQNLISYIVLFNMDTVFSSND